MNRHSKILLVLASLFATSSIILASVGAHAGADALIAKQLTDTFDKAVDYSIYNAISLLGIAGLCQICINSSITHRFHWAGYCIAMGGFIFQTSLFLYTLADMKWLIPFTPLGGMLMILGWFMLGVMALFLKKKSAN